ncbi:DNA-binding domain-containing protein [Parabacteroides sp.]
MEDEKVILSVDLYDNVLTEKVGDYTGKIRITGTVRTKDVANRVVNKRTEYRPETIVNILELSYQEMIEALVQGKCVVNALGQFLLSINGPFDGKKQDYKSELNRITVTFTPSAALLKALENIYVNADVATVGPMIENITDSTTGEVNLLLTPNAPAIITGSTLLIKGDSPSNGVYFTKDEEGAQPQKVKLVVRNTKGEIIIQIPNLTDGQYWLSVTTQVGSNYTVVKEPRTYRFPILLTVGETTGGGGDSESPDEV